VKFFEKKKTAFLVFNTLATDATPGTLTRQGGKERNEYKNRESGKSRDSRTQRQAFAF
jgi:hypothetical protein